MQLVIVGFLGGEAKDFARIGAKTQLHLTLSEVEERNANPNKTQINQQNCVALNKNELGGFKFFKYHHS